MPTASDRLRKRKAAIAKIDELAKSPESVVIVHYSCESFYDRPDGRSPRITSIAVRNLGSAQTTSFSIHQVAERQGTPTTEIKSHYDTLEKAMLDEWFAYVHKHTNVKWLHWNMRDINYGFPAIAHRYLVLGGTPIQLEESRLYDLARLLIDVHGPEYAGHPRLESLCHSNRISLKDFLVGKDEAAAFEAEQYVKLHQSTLRKVDIIANIFNRYCDRRLITTNKWWQPYGSRLLAVGEFLKEHPIAAIAFALIAVASLVAGLISIFGSLK